MEYTTENQHLLNEAIYDCQLKVDRQIAELKAINDRDADRVAKIKTTMSDEELHRLGLSR